MLTKEECMKALDSLSASAKLISCCTWNYEKVLRQLINEHFDNPALHLDELKIGMWVYDATINKYRRIVNIQENKLYFEGQKLGVNFKEDKFYRKLVE